MATVQVWDPLIRIFHWTVAVVFVANYFFNEIFMLPLAVSGLPVVRLQKYVFR